MNRKVDSAILLCAGLGTRLKPITDQTPKPLVRLLNIPLLQYHFDLLNRHQFKKAIINVHHLGDELIAGVNALDRGALQIEFSDERGLLLDSAGGIRTAAEKLQAKDFLTLNGDVFFDFDVGALKAVHEKTQQGSMTLALRRNESSEKYRELVLDSATGRIVKVGEKIEKSLYFTGAAMLSFDLIRSLPVGAPLDFVKSILSPAVAAKQAFAVEQSGLWLDLGSPQLVFEAHFALMNAIEARSLRLADRASRENIRLGVGQWVSKSTRVSEALKASAVQFYVSGDFSKVSSLKHPVVSYEKSGVDPGRSALVYGGHTISCDEARLRLS